MPAKKKNSNGSFDRDVLRSLYGKSLLLTSDWTTPEIECLLAVAQRLERLDQLVLTTSLPIALGAVPVLVAAVALHPRIAPRRRFSLIGLAVLLTGAAIGICARAWMDAQPIK